MKEETRRLDSAEAITLRAEELFREHQQSVYVRTDHWFAILMALQWVAGIIAALVISPRTWIGERSQVHVHVWAALFLGAALSGFPVILALLRPGKMSTRNVIAVAQMLWSALLIHLTGGRIETHFHVFGSLAFLAFYGDWRVLVPATLVVAADHLVRGLYYPESVFGVLVASPWRWLEHAGWVLFEDTFLIAACLRSVRDMRNVAERTAQLEATNQNIEGLVKVRTAELEDVHKRLFETSRNAGMAEVATSVLHNVGNVLNSVNVSACVVKEKITKSKLSGLARATELMRTHAHDLGAFLTENPQGRQLPQYFDLLAKGWQDEQVDLLSEVESLHKYVNHIKSIIATQQSLTGASNFTQSISVTKILDEALEIGCCGFEKNGIQIERDNGVLEPVIADQMKIMMIVINLLRNAKDALVASNAADRRLTVRSELNGDGCLHIEVIDNGIGIAPEVVPQLFTWGFTTKSEGHGFGLHSSALAAKEMGGSLQASSDGPGRGARFTLEVPVGEETVESDAVAVGAAAQ